MHFHTQFRVVSPHEVLEELVDVVLGQSAAVVHLLDGGWPVRLESERLLARAVARLLPCARPTAGTDRACD